VLTHHAHIGWFALLVGACSPRAAAPSAAPNSVPGAREAVPEAAEPGRSGVASCKEVGLLPCEVLPTSEAELCPGFAQCLIGMQDEYDVHPKSDVDCGPLQNFTPAPAGSGLQKTAVVVINGKLDAEEESSWRTEATYLVAQTERGFCLVDQLISWDTVRDYSITNEFATTWTAGASPAPELQVQIHMIAELDSDEGTFVDHESCTEARYRLAGGRLEAMKKADREGGCSPGSEPK